MSATVSHCRVWLVQGVVVCLALVAAGTPAEISGGSILAFHFSGTAIVVAADSSRHTSTGEVPDRPPCKIAVLGPQLFFARSGRTHINSWTTTDEARAAFDGLGRKEGGEGFAHAIAERWGERTKRMYERAWAAQGNRLFHGLEDNTITLGIFGGEEAGELFLYVVAIKFALRGEAPPGFSYTVERAQPEATAPIRVFGDLPSIRGVTEFFSAATPRSRLANERFLQSQRHVPGGKAEELIAAVEAAIAWADDPVRARGPVDALVLERGKGIQWILRKSGCPAD